MAYIRTVWSPSGRSLVLIVAPAPPPLHCTTLNSSHDAQAAPRLTPSMSTKEPLTPTSSLASNAADWVPSIQPLFVHSPPRPLLSVGAVLLDSVKVMFVSFA
jgi:hypothetical protein